MMVLKKACGICERIALCRRGEDPYLIHEFENSILVLGEHQFHTGYSVLILKQHAREPYELPDDIQTGLFRELAASARAIAAAFRPLKMNYACLGNLEPHIHWHLIPRYESDPDRLSHPWLHEDEFSQHRIVAEDARALIERVRQHLFAAPLGSNLYP